MKNTTIDIQTDLAVLALYRKPSLYQDLDRFQFLSRLSATGPQCFLQCQRCQSSPHLALNNPSLHSTPPYTVRREKRQEKYRRDERKETDRITLMKGSGSGRDANGRRPRLGRDESTPV
ncbi:uncharacterized [Tachysurus ichikawai]